MKIGFILTLFCVIQLHASLYSQSTKFNLDFNNATLREVLREVENKSEFRFFYSDDLLFMNKRITFKSDDSNVHQILDKLLTNSHLTYKVFEDNLIIITPLDQPGQRIVTGKVTDASTGEPIPGVNIYIEGTTRGTITTLTGEYNIEIPGPEAVLIYSFIGYISQSIIAGDQVNINISLAVDFAQLEEVIVVGYGRQKRSDITGTVASLSRERLEMVPNLNIAQALQGSIPGISVTTTAAGASPTEVLMVRGRNSIRASNNPLIVVDGIPYAGALRDINPNDVESIEILKDASAAAIYGSRGSNGVILVTTKQGLSGAAKFSYDGYYSMQSHINYPEYLTGEEFYEFKNTREPGQMTLSEQEVYDAGEWVDWYKEGSRPGSTNQHNLSVAGGFGDTRYFIAGNLLDVKGIAINDDYMRLTGRINVDTKISNWLTIGTRTTYSHEDMSGVSPDYNYPTAILSRANPLTKAYNDDGSLTIYIWPEDQSQGNPLAPTLYDDTDIAHQIVSNNYALVEFPFAPGLSYRINTGIRNRFADRSTYIGRDTRTGLIVGGQANTTKSRADNTIIENILNYTRDIGLHRIFFTGVYSYEHNKSNSNSVEAKGFPNDFLSIYAISQADLITPGYSFSESVLLSQMLRLNYTYDSRYLFTFTGRRDGFSGFGADSKWGLFPSFAFGWNLANEEFFPWRDVVNELKPRFSFGLNGNQAVGVYESISRLTAQNHISNGLTQAGYKPSRLGVENLGWESSQTFNLGVDFGIYENRISGDLNLFNTKTFDLLLNRTISQVHGITSIVQNIGETQNKGVEFLVNSRNIVHGNFRWATTANISYTSNRILSLYGELDDEGKEIDDVSNRWFIGQPIRVNYDFIWDGVWQLDEAEEAAKYGCLPGYVKLRDVNGDYKLDAADRQIQGQIDPKMLWGLTNTFSYKNFSLNVFIHGVHGSEKLNPLMEDGVWESVRLNTTRKNWWTPDNPTNEWIKNDKWAHVMAGYTWTTVYEKADFVRIKDITLSYDLSDNITQRIRVDKLRLFANGRNLITFTKYGGLDPELSGQLQFPLQKEFVFGMNLSF